ncbi:hypothetical protein BCR15_12945 [Tessaracoccus lapidicaptus]|uniref:ATPase AAA-type core domain-containing protein n=1 Tax=Tessaracoccus lapidicaptus TaxID=1427523 RepID=A0A1C0ARE0_9ACTN|nr:hypothetical protein BCR15_12945 [Tessaracoccus lapidicaptus]
MARGESVMSFEPSTALVDALDRSQYVALTPIGTNEGRWEVWLCVSPQESPALSAEVEHVTRIMDAVAALRGASASVADAVGLAELHHGAALRPESVRALDEYRRELLDLISIVETEELPSMVRYLLERWEGLEPDGKYNSIGAPGDLIETYELYPLWARHAVCAWSRGQATFDEDWVPLEQNLRAWFQDGLPVPVARIGEVSKIPWVSHGEESAADAERVTLDQLGHQIWGQWKSWHPTEADMESSRSWASRAETRANAIYHDLLQDAPKLRLVLYGVRDWPAGPLDWGAASDESEAKIIPVSQLSTAEARWAQLAITLAVVDPDISDPDAFSSRAEWPENLSARQLLSARNAALDDCGRLTRSGPSHRSESAEMQVVILDEPESALHRSAERYMARGLDALTMSGRQVVVATHSPEILNRPEIALVHVSREGRGTTTVRQMAHRDLTRATTELGLAPSDLIGLHRVFLLVEGEHDEIVVETLLADVLDGARVKIVAMRGGSKLPTTVESQLMFDMSTAHVVALLDNVDRRHLDAVWDEAQQRFLTTGPDDAIAFLTAATRHLKGEEFKWITQWLARAIKKGTSGRLVPFGLSAADIIEYLPVQVIAPMAGKEWPALRAEHEDAKASLDKAKGLHDFKAWLQRTYGADLSPVNIRAASQALHHVPEELRTLGYRLREIASR